VKSSLVGDVVDAAHTEKVPHVEALEGIVGPWSNTSVAAVGMVADHTWLGHVDHAQQAMPLMQESWSAECGKRSEGTAERPFEMQPLYPVYLASRQ
jgi:hypothetical protein